MPSPTLLHDATDRFLAVCQLLMHRFPEVADHTVVLQNAQIDWQKQHGSLEGRWWGQRKSDGSVRYHWYRGSEGRTQRDPPGEPVAVIFEIHGRPLSDWLAEEYEPALEARPPYRRLVGEEEYLAAGAARAALTEAPFETVRDLYSSNGPFADDWDGPVPLPTLGEMAEASHAAGQITGEEYSGILWSLRLSWSVGEHPSGEIDPRAAQAAVAGWLSGGKTVTGHNLLIRTTEMAAKLGQVDAILSSWECFYDEFQRRLDEGLNCPDWPSYIRSLRLAYPHGYVADWVAQWCVQHPRGIADAGLRRLRGARHRIEEDQVRGYEVAVHYVRDHFTDGEWWEAMVRDLAATLTSRGRSAAVLKARRMSKDYRYFPLSMVETLVNEAEIHSSSLRND